jgi:hypothetical protein
MRILSLTGWLFGLTVFAIGVLNIVLVHPVPGVVYLLLSLLYFPPISKLFMEKVGFSASPVVKIIIGILIIWFTLGVSDLGDMID